MEKIEKAIQWPPNDKYGNPISVEEWKTHPGNFWRQLPHYGKRMYNHGDFKPFIKDGTNYRNAEDNSSTKEEVE